MAQPRAHIELQSVIKTYGSQFAVRDLSLTVNRGEFFCLLGPSGCGKTTTLNMIAGFSQPDGGQIWFDGQSMVGIPVHKRNIGMVFQNYALFPHMSVYENIAFGLRRRRVGRDEERQRVAEALRLVSLEGKEKRLPTELSGGQQQRVALARALVIRPAVLLLDEPLSNLDAKLREQMRVELRRIQKAAEVTTIFVTHDQEEALSMADRVAVMNLGVLQQLAPPTEIYHRPANPFVAGFIGQANLIPGTVVSVSQTASPQGSAVILETPLGRLPVHADGHPTVQTEATLLIRPERLRLNRPPIPGGISIPGRVRSVTFLGPSQRVEVNVGDRTLIATATADTEGTSLAVSDAVEVSWDPAEVVLLENGG